MKFQFDKLYAQISRHSYCLKFFEDGSVISATIAADVRKTEIRSQVDTWFRRGFTSEHGTFELDGNKISFTIISANGRVDFKGLITEEGLDLEIKSHINGHSDRMIYTLIG